MAYACNNIDINMLDESLQFLIYFTRGQKMKRKYIWNIYNCISYVHFS